MQQIASKRYAATGKQFARHRGTLALTLRSGLSPADANGCHAVILSLLKHVGSRPILHMQRCARCDALADGIEVRVTHPADAAVRLAPCVAVRADNLKRVQVQQHGAT